MVTTPKEILDHVRLNWEPRPTLRGGSYHLPEVWEAEKERIFANEWICVGREEEIPNTGDTLTRDVADESILITRNKAGDLRAFFNVCAHRGTRLCDSGPGHAKSNAIVCPYHAWTYDTDGKLMGTPNVHEEEGFDKSTRPLWTVAVDTWDGYILVNLGPEPRPLEDWFADNPEGDPRDLSERWNMGDLRIGARIDYEVEANWKIVVENFNECLHCPSVHPELVQLVPLFRKGMTEGEDGAQLAEGAVTLTPSGQTNRAPLPGLEAKDLAAYNGYTLFPTLLVNLHSESVMIYRLEPRGPNHTTVISEFLFHPDAIAAPDFDPSDIVNFWDLVSRQDWEVCERAHTGMTSRAYAKGGVYPFNDRWVSEFNERYRSAMGAE